MYKVHESSFLFSPFCSDRAALTILIVALERASWGRSMCESFFHFAFCLNIKEFPQGLLLLSFYLRMAYAYEDLKLCSVCFPIMPKKKPVNYPKHLSWFLAKLLHCLSLWLELAQGSHFSDIWVQLKLSSVWAKCSCCGFMRTVMKACSFPMEKVLGGVN